MVLLAEAHGTVSEETLVAMRQAVRYDRSQPCTVECFQPVLYLDSSGKIRRSEARQRWLDEVLSAPDRPGVLRLLAETFAGRRFDATQMKTEIAVVGGGPAGLAAALALAKVGRDVCFWSAMMATGSCLR